MDLRAVVPPQHPHGSPSHRPTAMFVSAVLLAFLALITLARPAHGAVMAVAPCGVPSCGTPSPSVASGFSNPIGGAGATFGFDESGHAPSACATIFNHHESQACGGFVDPARRSSWGAVKLHYR